MWWALDLSGGSGSVECQANFNFQVSLVYFPIVYFHGINRVRLSTFIVGGGGGGGGSTIAVTTFFALRL